MDRLPLLPLRLVVVLSSALLLPGGVARAEDPPPAAATTPPPPQPEPAWHDPVERPGKRQLFLGLRYRGTVVPQFLMNLFANEGKTLLIHTGGIELEVRRDRMSLLPWVSYTDYRMDDTLFLEKNKDASKPGSWSFANSSVKALFAGIDILWSVPLGRFLDFEAGLGVGVGYLFGDFVSNWVYDDPSGRLVSSAGRHFSGCVTAADAASCDKANHNNAKVDKVNRYVEPTWFGGGTVPNLYARITAPILGLRFKPIRAFTVRVNVATSLTEGFVFGANLDFRLPGS